MADREPMPWCPRRAWSARSSVTFPVIALAFGIGAFATADVEATAVAALAVSMVPWALLAWRGSMPSWLMIPMVIVPVWVAAVPGEVIGALMVPVVLVGWITSEDRHRAPAAVAFVVATVVAFWSCHTAHSAEWRAYPHAQSSWIYFTFGYAFAGIAGMMLTRERALLAELRRTQSARARAETLADRQVMAREIHDIVGHSLTVMMLNVTGARRHLSRNPAAADEALARAEEVGRQSLDHVRQVVGLLRDDSTTGTDAPLPSATDITVLVADARAAGMTVDLAMAGDVGAVDPATGLTAYRAVQEGLANANHHAPGAPVSIEVHSDATELAVVVRNPLARERVRRSAGEAFGGFGLPGLRERVAASGGEVVAGPTAAGAWVLECHLPLAAHR